MKERVASQMLLLATLLWGLSFPVMKAITMLQQELLPQASNWFLTAISVTVRFAASALIILLISFRSLRRITRCEIWQGLGLGFFNAFGILLQVDGLAYTSASVSAFLTQATCLFIPLWLILRYGRWPTLHTAIGCAIVLIGVAVLSGVNWQNLTMLELAKPHHGRGEIETLLGAVFFTGQILWLERPVFARNSVRHFSLIMFATIALLALPLALVTMREPRDIVLACSTSSIAALIAVLVIFCTMGAYMMMNNWQPCVSATTAGVIYCAEPVFASLFALFLPAWFSKLWGISYPNEAVTLNLLIGGGLITVANIFIQNQRVPEIAAAKELETISN